MTERHKPQEPTTDDHGAEMHPAFGSITAHRITSNPGSILFDSDVQHQHLVRVTVGRMARGRGLGRDWLHPSSRHPLVEVDMSEAQWASFVSSMNTSAVPCTIRATESEPNVPGLEHAPRLAQSMAEVHAAATEAFAKIQQAMAELDALDPKAGVKERRAKLQTLRSVISNAVPNVDFAGKQLVEHTENVVQRARADIEAMVTHKAQQLGIEPGDIAAPLALGAAPDIEQSA